MSLLKKNIIANFAGSIWVSLMGLAFIPLYIKFLGIESWGLIGIFATFQAVLSLLDLGLSSTLNREMARLSGMPGKEQEVKNLLRTLELVYWCISALVGIAVILLSPIIAQHWIKSTQLSPKIIEQSILIMGIIIALQLPIGLYSGGLMGLQRHVLLNKINVIISTLRGTGAILILWLVSRTIQTFFLWQIVTSLLNVLLLAVYLWRILPVAGNKAVFEKKLFKGIWRFAAGVSGISLLAMILTQSDKIILSKIITLDNFGYYMLASAIAFSIGRIVAPIFNSIYPRFTQLASNNEQEELIKLYHKICQFLSVLILPITIIVALFSYEILLFWTQNPVMAEKSHLCVSILICGTALNGLMNPPYALQLAFSWTRLAFFKNVISIIVIVPLIFYLTIHYGTTGAAVAWLILNVGDFFFEITIMHSKLLRKEKWRWYLQDVCLPLIAGLIIAGAGRILMSWPLPQAITLFYIVIISFMTFGVTAVVTPATRALLFEHFLRIKNFVIRRKNRKCC